MLSGAHVILYSSNPDADRRFLREVLQLRDIDEGGGYLIFALPAAEASVHDAHKSGPSHELYLICDDIQSFVASMERNRVAWDPVQDTGWGLLTTVTLPGGGKLGVYEAKHRRP